MFPIAFFATVLIETLEEMTKQIPHVSLALNVPGTTGKNTERDCSCPGTRVVKVLNFSTLLKTMLPFLFN